MKETVKEKTIADVPRAWDRAKETCAKKSGALQCTRGQGHGGALHEQVKEEHTTGRIGESTFFT